MPGCGAGGKFGRGIHTRTLATNCWKCGPARLGDVLAAASGRPLREIIPKLGETAPALRTDGERPAGRYTPPAGVGPLLPAHRRYLARRGFDPDVIVREWGIGGIGGDHPLKWRLFIPIVENGKPVSWTTRAVGADPVRYRSARPEHESVSAHDVIYGADRCGHTAIVMEGPISAWAGGPGCCATLGLTVTPRQKARLARFPVRVICFDNTDDAQRRAGKLADELAVFPGETYVARLTTGKDAAECDPAEVAELREKFLDDLTPSIRGA